MKKFFELLAGTSQFLSNGVFGDGVNDYLQIRDIGGTALTHTLPASWTFEFVIKCPTTVSFIESLFSSNVPNVGANLLNINTQVIAGSSPERWKLAVTMRDPSQTAIFTNVELIKFPNNNSTRKNIHVVMRSTFSTTYLVEAFVNGIKIQMGSPTSMTPASFGFGFLQDRSDAARYSDGTFFGARFYDRALSDAECFASYNNGKYSDPVGANLIFDQRLATRNGNDFADKFDSNLKITGVNFANIANNLTTFVRSTGFRRLVCVGNSLTLGTGSTAGNDYPNLLYYLLNNVIYENVYSLSTAGSTTPNLIAAFLSRPDTYYRDTSNTIDLYIAWEVTNDLFFGASAATAYANYVTWCNMARAAGFKVIAMTVLPRSNAGTPVNFPTSRATVNTNIRNNYLTFADALADVAADSRIGDDGDENDLTYYTSDKVHMNDAGYAVVAGIVKNTIETAFP